MASTTLRPPGVTILKGVTTVKCPTRIPGLLPGKDVKKVFHPGQLVMIDIPGTTLDARTAAFLRRRHIRAVCLFRKNLTSETQARQLTRDLRTVMGPDSLIALDQEGGSVIRATFLPQPPSAMGLSATGDDQLAESVGAAVARGLRSIGINWNLAPITDINNNSANPVIAERSFGETAQTVTRFAGAWMRGSMKAGVACCIKHFPGHGDTQVDSHLDLPTIDKSHAELAEFEFKPFKALGASAPSLMTAHIMYPQIDPHYPATLSRTMLSGILRKQWRYRGVIITDALMMKAIAHRYGYSRASMLAIRAGADMILAQGSRRQQLRAVEALTAGFDRGELDLADGQRAAMRLNQMAQAYPVRHEEYPTKQREADDALVRRAWAAGLCVLGGAVAPSLESPVRVVVQDEVPTDGISEAGLGSAVIRQLFAAHRDVDFACVADISALDWENIPADGRVNIVVSTERSRYSKPRTWRPDLHVVLGNPFQALDVAAPTVLTWGYSEGALDALQAWLHGRAVAPGRSPVTLS